MQNECTEAVLRAHAQQCDGGNESPKREERRRTLRLRREVNRRSSSKIAASGNVHILAANWGGTRVEGLTNASAIAVYMRDYTKKMMSGWFWVITYVTYSQK